MTYAKKLLIAKILVSAGLLLFAIAPFLNNLHLTAEDLNAVIHTYRLGGLYGNVIALPIMMFAIWSKLHGTGRSVRLVGFLGLAGVLGVFMASGVLDVSTLYVLAFILLLSGVLLSIRRSADA